MKRMCSSAKKKIDMLSSANTGRLPSSVRRFVQRSVRSDAVGMLEQVRDERLLVVEVDDDVLDHPVILAVRCADVSADWSGQWADRPARPARSSSWSQAYPCGMFLRVVEVDDEADPSARDPHADADAVVLLVHQVDVVAAVVRLLALEEPVRAEHGRSGTTGAAADVLGPGVVGVSGSTRADRRGSRR